MIMSNRLQSRAGFTLIELMIGVTVIGILASIAFPKFAQSIRKSKEGRTNATLSAIREAIRLYYSDNNGIFPLPAMQEGDAPETALFVSVMVPKYIEKIPQSWIGLPGWDNDINNNENYVVSEVGSAFATDPAPLAAWYYDPNGGKIWLGARFTDIQGRPYSVW